MGGKGTGKLCLLLVAAKADGLSAGGRELSPAARFSFVYPLTFHEVNTISIVIKLI